jgi:hypothetical protein
MTAQAPGAWPDRTRSPNQRPGLRSQAADTDGKPYRTPGRQCPALAGAAADPGRWRSARKPSIPKEPECLLCAALLLKTWVNNQYRRFHALCRA